MDSLWEDFDFTQTPDTDIKDGLGLDEQLTARCGSNSVHCEIRSYWLFVSFMPPVQ